MVSKPILVSFGFVLILINTHRSYGRSNLQKDITSKIENNNEEVVLSRRRRYLQFPAGSSFQLVFCFTYPSVGVGSYFVFGHTAALAFELPSMPLHFDGKDFQKKDEEPTEAATTEMLKGKAYVLCAFSDYPELKFTHFNRTDHERVDHGYSPWNLPNSNMPISSYKNEFMDYVKTPVYSARRRTNNYSNSDINLKYQQAPYSQRYNINNQHSHMKLTLDPKFYSIHRRSRREVYKKIESFLSRLNLDGKACLLKAICETRQLSNDKQTFFKESFKGLFRAKPHDDHDDEDEYDAAYNPNHNCEEMFSGFFDLAYPCLDTVGFFVYGNTAGLAWELPSEPIFLDAKHGKHEPPTTTMLPHLEHPDVEYEDWHSPQPWNDFGKMDYQVADKQSYNPNHNLQFDSIDRSPVSSYYNPFDSYSQKYSSNKYPVHYVRNNPPNAARRYSYKANPNGFWNNRRSFQTTQRYRAPQYKSESPTRNYDYGDDLHHIIHRRTRRELYGKLEELISALIRDGKSCILKTICQLNKSPKEKGTFFEELLKTIFKVKPDEFHQNEDDYDLAANLNHNCEEMYPACEGNVLTKIMNVALKK
ncbi:unnamed protein product [Ceutorhynchus assimilis]|uniref:Uncharacterized protein n=1 Tax=Ceutorhynchus assimilis TaxID=467358 RepID=A0A9N9QRW2_9CUCU|nr:unnamed protein product [Ceutorhynchus assimilis]